MNMIAINYLLLMIYHFFLYYVYKKNYSALYFSIMCFIAFVFNIIEIMRYTVLYKISIIIFLLTAYMFFFIGNLILKKTYNKKIVKAFLVITVVGVLSLLLISSKQLMQYMNYIVILYLSLTLVYLIFYTMKSIPKKEEDVELLLIGYSMIALTYMNQLSNNELMGRYFFHLIEHILVIVYLFILAKKLSTAYKLSEINVWKRSKELEVVNKDKDKMFALLSHDLRAPIGGIVQSLELILDKKNRINNPEMVFDLIKISYKASILTFQLIENMFLWISMNNGKIVYLPKVDVDLNKIIRKNITTLENISNLKGISLKKNLKGNLKFFGDAYMIEIVIRNLISNAIKYTDEGGEIKINSTLQGDKVLVEVKDNGIGMNEEIKNAIFSEKAVSQSGTNGEKGSSLGLKLAKEFIEKHNGKIWVESKLEVGTSVYFIIPQKTYIY
ncbi:MAG: hypothetical protein B6I28_05270 [Fusobacteriia bacterium 4572_132]|nr:MAG: hypothetical protein B6I28_05270 [Fusobacteriia bacterium 4572_132]